MTFRKIALTHTILFLVVAFVSVSPWYYLMLTAAQLIYVPLALHLIMKKGDWFNRLYPYISTPAYLSIVILQVTSQTAWDGLLATIYFLFTFFVAVYGFTRFLNRGFAHLEECSIDIGLMYLWIGGAWFLAHEANIDTGFSPIIRWLTGIHFHHSAFLLPIFVGFLGRLSKSTLYKVTCSIILISPIIVALGITFSRWLELISVILYIIGIYGLIFLSWKAPIHHVVAKVLIRFSFAALGVTILFSFLYALGNVWREFTITIDFMLRFHGLLNGFVFAFIGLIGWSLFTPLSKMDRWDFPISKIRGKKVIGERILEDIKDRNKDTFSYKGLVDNMHSYEPEVCYESLSPTILDFYENTNNYRLFAEVKWRTWFKPFVLIYRLISRYVQQLNLPLSSDKKEMTGNIYPIQDEMDGRNNTRSWVRKMEDEVVFVALYSSHQKQNHTYMNIALPLPWSSMIGILELKQYGKELILTSKSNLEKADSDSGIYLAIHNYLLKLPIHEQFNLMEIRKGVLKAQHNMWIFSIPFLTIDYFISHRNAKELLP
ncbi:YndJ family protein [Risungbinella massiliensis]|uniref:YndJ family protein n=1 Tax=Risungbinella massiliensis TaxID=1329796 RepID=UPI00069A6F0A|nr:YndJ family protein [Risungbinella massiliensis]